MKKSVIVSLLFFQYGLALDTDVSNRLADIIMRDGLEVVETSELSPGDIADIKNALVKRYSDYAWRAAAHNKSIASSMRPGPSGGNGADITAISLADNNMIYMGDTAGNILSTNLASYNNTNVSHVGTAIKALVVSADNSTRVLAREQTTYADLLDQEANVIQRLDLHDAQVTALAVSGDGNMIMIGYADGKIEQWLKRENEYAHEQDFDGHASTITSLSLSADCATMMSTADGDNKEHAIVLAKTDNPDGTFTEIKKTIINKSLIVWNIKTGEEISSSAELTNARAGHLSPDATKACVMGDMPLNPESAEALLTGVLKLVCYDLSDNTVTQEKLITGQVCCLSMTCDSKLVAIGSKSTLSTPGYVELFGTTQLDSIKSYGNLKNNSAVTFSNDNKVLIVAASNDICIWDINDYVANTSLEQLVENMKQTNEQNSQSPNGCTIC